LVAFGLFAGAWAASGQEAAWTTNGPLGGSVYCLVPDPSHPATVYAGTAVGAFKSDDGGVSWRSASSGLPSFRVQTIVIDPTTPSTLYAGTLTPDGVDSVGIFKRTDGAASWTAINVGMIDPITGVSPLDVWSLAIDPKNPGTILAGSRFSEIFKSVDGGLTWQPKTFGGYQYSLETSAFQFDPTNSSRILAATNPLGLMRSTDGGESWSTYGGVSDPFFTIVTDPTTPATLAGVPVGPAFSKHDSGGHWSTINKGLPVNGGSLPLVRGFAVDPAHPANLYAGTYGNGLYRSTDGGLNWSPASGAMHSNYVAAIAFGPSSTLLAGTLFSGVYRSADKPARGPRRRPASTSRSSPRSAPIRPPRERCTPPLTTAFTRARTAAGRGGASITGFRSRPSRRSSPDPEIPRRFSPRLWGPESGRARTAAERGSPPGRA
jgi:photosystem II stability/assembly factor-like uncharacterized protein